MISPSRMLVGWGLIALCAFAPPASACLTFCLTHEKEVIYGRNFDWSVGIGAVIVNPRHVRKAAFTPPTNTSETWTSTYGSVTFNQFSRDVPVGGMNEKGLVIECLVSKASHPQADRGKVITELQWIQYHLDTCKSVDEVIASAKTIRISKYAVSLHYFIADATGASAVIEFLDGRMVHRTGDTLPKKVLANMAYDDEVKHAAKDGQSRFSRAGTLIAGYDGRKKPVQFAYDTLDAVAQGDFTKWQVVYDVVRRTISFRTLDSKKLKTIQFSKLDFPKLATTKSLDVNLDASGDATAKFEEHTQKMNDALMTRSLNALQKKGRMRRITPTHIAYIRGVLSTYRNTKPEE